MFTRPIAPLADAEFAAHEEIVVCYDPDAGLSALIAVHDTSLGPAAGGCRLYPYADAGAALHDVLRLSRAMSLKNALAGLTPITVVANAGKSTSRGVELEISARPSDNLRLGLSYGLTDTRFDRFIQFGVDRAGDPFWSIPNNTASATLDWSLPLASGRSIDLGLSWQYVDDYTIPDGSSLSPSPAFENVNESYSRVNLRAGIELESGWEVSAYVRNVLDSFDYTLIGRDFVAPTPFNNNTLYVVPLEPRNYGLQVRKRF